MGVHVKNLEHVLREKETQLLDLQQEIEVLRSAGQILGARVESARTNLHRNKMSQPEMIKAVLLEQARPLHVNELQKKIEEKFGMQLKNGDITSVIYRAMRGGALFRKEGVNTFGLIEWKGRRNLQLRVNHKRRLS